MQSALAQKSKNFLKNIWNGVKTLFQIQNKPLFLFYTLAIWLLYFAMFYFSFYAFDFTESLSVLAGLLGFTMGSFGVVAPVQGGIGAWHFMVIESLKLYGVADYQAAAFAFITHLVQTIMLVSVGFICFISLPFLNRK